MSTKIVQVKPLTLNSNIGTSNTTAIVSGMIGLDGEDLVQADFGSIIYGTIEPNTPREEAVSFTITSCVDGVANIDFGASGRGLIGKHPYGTGGITYAHSAGVKLVISNNPNLFNKFTAKDNDEQVIGQWSFPTPTLDTSPATKAFVQAASMSGGTEATENSRGTSKLSASPNVTLGTATITIATPGVVTLTAHGLVAGDSIQFTTTGALPTGLSPLTTYYVIAAGLTANTFQLSTTIGGSAINTTGSQSGTHTLVKVTPIAVGYNDTTKLPTLIEKAAMTGDTTPSAVNKFLTKGKLVTAGATISGATLPVPVYQNKTDNEFYACDANDTAAMKFIGFAISNGTDGASMNVQFSGIVSGFTGLSEGEKYYVQDTAGTIGTTIGTNEILVGVAISETELLIQKGTYRAAGNGSAIGTASGSQVVTTGFRPSVVRIRATAFASTTTPAVSFLDLTWVNGVINGLASGTAPGGAPTIENSARLYLPASFANYMTFSITSVTDTGFTISWTETGTYAPADDGFYWEAEGEL